MQANCCLLCVAPGRDLPRQRRGPPGQAGAEAPPRCPAPCCPVGAASAALPGRCSRGTRRGAACLRADLPARGLSACWACMAPSAGGYGTCSGCRAEQQQACCCLSASGCCGGSACGMGVTELLKGGVFCSRLRVSFAKRGHQQGLFGGWQAQCPTTSSLQRRDGMGRPGQV